MTIWRKAAKRDNAEQAIVDTLIAVKARVWRLSAAGLPDLLVGYQGRLYLFECKTGKRKLGALQEQFMAECRFRNLPAYVVRTPEDALHAIGAVH